jgi:hypothetical protein
MFPNTYFLFLNDFFHYLNNDLNYLKGKFEYLNILKEYLKSKKYIFNYEIQLLNYKKIRKESKMRKLVILFIILITNIRIFADDDNYFVSDSSNDYLESVDNFIGSRNDDYHKLLSIKLMDSLSQFPLARIIIEPAFNQEGLISIEKENNSYVLIYKEPNKSIWYAMIKNKENRIPKLDANGNIWEVITMKTNKAIEDEITVKTKKIEIEQILAFKIQELFWLALSQAKQVIDIPEYICLISGTEESHYYFFSYNSEFGLKIGETWVYIGQEKMSRLASIYYLLKELLDYDNKYDEKKNEIIKKCDELIKELKE